MTKVTVVYKNGHIVSMCADGHTGYGVEGEDILCAALSSIIQTALLGLMQVAGIQVSFQRSDEEGKLAFSLPSLDSKSRRDADMILGTCVAGIDDLYSNYSDFIEIEKIG
ncbi:MAG: ribosomal-processing cysteine protease Prp [Clostridia bacterium]|nr:ribosomal-processing cysteine protease Prp [Clostridia bacterium]